MCCLLATLFAFGPRAAILIWYVVEPVRWNTAFDTFLWPLLGFLVAPWTTLMYVLVFPAGINGFDWIWLGLCTEPDRLIHCLSCAIRDFQACCRLAGECLCGRTRQRGHTRASRLGLDRLGGPSHPPSGDSRQRRRSFDDAIQPPALVRVKGGGGGV